MTTEVTASFSQLDVKLNGSSLSGDLERDLAEIEVENSLYLPDTCTIRFHLSSMEDKLLDVPDTDMRNYLSQGAEIEISEKENGATHVIFDGEVTSVGLEFSDYMASGQLLAVVQGYDRSHRLHRGRKTKTYNQMSYSDIVKKVVSGAKLQADVEATSGVPEYVIQSNQTDWEFLWQLANRVGYELHVTGKKLAFKKPRQAQGQPVKLNWGVELAQFRTRSSSTFQDPTVTVRSWDAKKKKAIVGQATSGSGGPEIEDSRTGTSQASSAFGDSKLLVVNRPVSTQAEADAMAQSYRNAITGEFIEAEGTTSHGMSAIVPGVQVDIEGLGQRSGKYHVTSTTHRYSGHMGYTTSFVSGGQSPFTVTEFVGGGTESPGLAKVDGVVIGLVSNNKDPDDLSRVKVEFPWLDENVESDWARIACPGAGKETGMHWLPEVGDEVLVAFEHGDIHRPYVLGGLWSTPDKPPEKNSSAVGGDGKVNLRGLTSREGLTLMINDESGKRSIGIANPDDKSKIIIRHDDKEIEILSNGDINIKGAQGKITVEGQNLEIKSSTNLKMSASGNLDITAGGNLTLKGVKTGIEASTQMTIKGTAQTSIQSSGITEIKGSLVKIN